MQCHLLDDGVAWGLRFNTYMYLRTIISEVQSILLIVLAHTPDYYTCAKASRTRLENVHVASVIMSHEETGRVHASTYTIPHTLYHTLGLNDYITKMFIWVDSNVYT